MTVQKWQKSSLGNDYVAIEVGHVHSLAIKSDGSLVAWGANPDGRCPANPGNDFIAVDGGADFTLAIKSDGSPTIHNVTAVDNQHGIIATGSSNPDIRNGIFWDNTNGDLDLPVGVEARYCWTQQNVDPLFADPNNGDYHLLSKRGRYNPTLIQWVLDDLTSPCIDAGDSNSDWSAEPQPNGQRINLGAYGGTAYASRTPTIVQFSDPNLQTAVEEELIKQAIYPPITEEDMLALTTLDAKERGIVDLTGLEYAHSLQTINLAYNELSFISALSGLTNLTWLNLGENNIDNLSALSELSSLTYLGLDGNIINDISPLIGLVNLRTLNLDRNNVEVISIVEPMAQMEWLSFQSNNIIDISPVARLTNLYYLRFSSNNISDILTLLSMNNLSYLNLNENPLNQVAYCVYQPIIKDNNPSIELYYDSNPNPLSHHMSSALLKYLMMGYPGR